MLAKIVALFIVVNIYKILAYFRFDPYEISINSISLKSKTLYNLNKKLKYVVSSYKNDFNMTVYQFIYVCMLLSLFGLLLGYSFTKMVVPSIIFASIIGLIPILLIDSMTQYYNNKLSLEVSKFVSLLTRWAVVKEDIYYCFEKSLPQIKRPLQSYISKFIMYVKYSGHIGYAFDIIIDQTYNEMLRNIMINLQQTTYSKGDLKELLERLEEESYQIYGEHERRRSETYFDKLAIYFSMMCVLLISIFVLILNEEMRLFYLTTSLGKWLLSLFSILFFLGVYLSSKITSFNY